VGTVVELEQIQGVHLPCGCVDFYREGANMVKI